MDKKALLEQFEQTKTYDLCKSWQIDFDENAEIYYSINPSYHKDVIALNAAWSMFQEQQSKVEELEEKIHALKGSLDAHNNRRMELISERLSAVKRSDELQKRVDKAITALKSKIAKVQKYEQDSFYHGAIIGLESALRTVEQALKGEG